ncbi:MAG: DUF7793 family protein [Bacteroidia bacterium]
MKPVTTLISIKSLDENGILHIKIIEGAHIDLESIIADHEVCKELIGAKKVTALFDARAFFTITAEARNYAKEKISDQSRIATAVLADNIAVKILAHGYIKINKPVTPMKIFKDRKKAIEWLMTFK